MGRSLLKTSAYYDPDTLKLLCRAFERDVGRRTMAQVWWGFWRPALTRGRTGALQFRIDDGRSGSTVGQVWEPHVMER
jgi:hypothetical protein